MPTTELYVDIPISQYQLKDKHKSFIICFYRKEDKQKFLKFCKKSKEINIDYYSYVNFQAIGIVNTNMVKCKARKNFNILHHLTDEFFSEEIPF